MTESLKYEIVQQEKNFEIRQYAEHIQAEVLTKEVSYRDALQRGFSILADYIFGNNRSQQASGLNASEKIAMTTPVTVKDEGHFKVSFFMPSAFTLETLPTPVNPAVQIRRVSPRLIAVARFNGYFNARSIAMHKSNLVEWLSRQKYRHQGNFSVAGYNPPWIPALLARNEVWVEVQPGQ